MMVPLKMMGTAVYSIMIVLPQFWSHHIPLSSWNSYQLPYVSLIGVLHTRWHYFCTQIRVSSPLTHDSLLHA